jgi:hypothetical protein
MDSDVEPIFKEIQQRKFLIVGGDRGKPGKSRKLCKKQLYS